MENSDVMDALEPWLRAYQLTDLRSTLAAYVGPPPVPPPSLMQPSSTAMCLHCSALCHTASLFVVVYRPWGLKGANLCLSCIHDECPCPVMFNLLTSFYESRPRA